MSDEGTTEGEGQGFATTPEGVALFRELRQMRAAIRAVVARHEAIQAELWALGDRPTDDETDDEERLWTELGHLCPLCGNDLDDGLGDAESWELGVHEGNDFMLQQSAETNTTMTIRRRWTIITEIGRMDSGQLFQFDVPDDDEPT